jgi:hypothetical protein
LTGAGELDGSFGTDGVRPLSHVRVDEVLVDDQDRVLAGGKVDYSDSSTIDLGAVRLEESGGALDPGFGSSGTAAVTPERDARNAGYGMALTDGGLVVAGTTDQTAAVAQFTTSATAETDAGGGDRGVAGDVTASPGIDVHQLITPRSWKKLINPGVRVLASCDRDCRLDVTVDVPNGVARAAGMGSTTIARGSAQAAAGEQHWVSAKAFASVRRALRSYGGRGRLHVAVTASSPS